MEFIIDNRETKAKQYFEDKPNVSVQNLDLGDFVFKYNGDIVCLIERKTISDMIASIKDGRYKEQKIRLKNCGIGDHKIIYLVEGAKLSLWDLSDKIVIGGIIGTLIRDNIKVFRTVSLQETMHFLERIYSRLLENPKKILPDDNIDDKVVHVNYANTLKVRKKENLTPQVCNILQLSQIPSISQNMASAVLDKYGSIFKLCLAYTQINDEKEKEKMVANIKFDIANGKQRKIGLVASSRLYQYLTMTYLNNEDDKKID
jgi:crossover junction endonuclease MUS81